MMINKCVDILKKHRETIAYLFFGGLAVLVNVAMYFLILLVTSDMIANSIAFVTSVLFSYWTNSCFVFQTGMAKKSFVHFFGARIGMIFIDNGGLWLLLQLNCNRLISKITISTTVIILNYILSKWVIFKRETK